MINDVFIYDSLTESIQNLRHKYRIPVHQLCSNAGVSTRTYSKLVKHIPVKNECYCRLVIGICKVVTPEDFTEFWKKIGEWIYKRYGES